jgi:hypothetical protein
MTLKSKKTCCYSFIPARVVFVLLGFFGICLVYAYKIALSVAIVSMVGHKNTTSETVAHECYNPNAIKNKVYIERDFADWDDRKQAIILGGFSTAMS